MHITRVHVHVKSAHIDDFAVAATCAGRRRTSGNHCFDALQTPDDLAQLVLYEAFADAAAHKPTAHYRHCRERVAPWMATPRRAVGYHDVGASDPLMPAT